VKISVILIIFVLSSANVAAKKSADVLIPKFAPGSIYLYSDGQWKPLVEATYEFRDIKDGNSLTEIFQEAGEAAVEATLKAASAQSPVAIILLDQIKKGKANTKEYVVTGWHATKYSKELKQDNVYFISHGMNNYHTEGWIKNIADALQKRDPESTILCVDWGHWATGAWLGLNNPIDPTVSAMGIDDAVDNAYNALLEAFDGQVDLSKFYFIGHSHGAHVVGRLTHKFGQKAKRITALDASEELSHFANSQKFMTWNADFIDYYKSSVICGTEYLVGNDNFILCEDDGLFNKNVFKDADRHGFACKWYAETVTDTAAVGGYNWVAQRKNYPQIINNMKGWDGVINAKRKVIECYSNQHDNPNLNYLQPWYQPESQEKPSEWKFRDAIGSTIDYEALTIEKSDQNDDANILRVNNLEKIHTTFNNNADPLSVPLDIRRSLSNAHVNIAFISRHTDDEPKYKLTKDADSGTTILTESPLFYLNYDRHLSPTIIENNGEVSSFNFHFTPNSELWQQLGGEPEDEYIDCDVWIIYGADRDIFFEEPHVTVYNVNNDFTAYAKPLPINFVKLWKGELDPTNNVITKHFRLFQFDCEAGPDQNETLKKGQSKVKIKVQGKVVPDNGEKLSYSWIYNNRVFSKNKSGTIKLGAGTHKLIFRVTDGLYSVSDSLTVTVIKEEPETIGNILDHPRTILNRHLVLSLGYGVEAFKGLNHYKCSASNAFSLYFGNISYIIKPPKSPIRAGLEYGLNLRFSNYNKQLITTLVSEDPMGDPGELTDVRITHLGGGGLPFGPIVSFMPTQMPNLSMSLYTHFCPYFMLLRT